jgi:hypothetical protein
MALVQERERENSVGAIKIGLISLNLIYIE